MIEIVREFVVKDEARGQFELAFGPGGAWSKLFAKSAGFRGTTALREVTNARRYIIIDLWDSEDQQAQAIFEHQEEYSDLEIAFEKWTESKTELGTFSVRAQASVRPRGNRGKGKARGSR